MMMPILCRSTAEQPSMKQVNQMNEPNRRDAIRLAAGGVALLGSAALGVSAAAAETPNQQDNSPEPSDDHKRVVAAGMTEDEATCWDAVADAAGKFFALPELHPMDAHEVAEAIHVIQHKLLARPTYRKYLELAKAAAEGEIGK